MVYLTFFAFSLLLCSEDLEWRNNTNALDFATLLCLDAGEEQIHDM